MFSCVWDLKIYHILYNVFHIWRTVRRSGRLCCEASWSTQQIWGHARPDNWHVIWNVESSKNIWHCHGLCESLGTTERQNHINFLGATQCACSPPSPPSTQSLSSSFRWLWTHNDVIDYFTKFVHSQPPPPTQLVPKCLFSFRWWSILPATGFTPILLFYRWRSLSLWFISDQFPDCHMIQNYHHNKVQNMTRIDHHRVQRATSQLIQKETCWCGSITLRGSATIIVVFFPIWITFFSFDRTVLFSMVAGNELFYTR